MHTDSSHQEAAPEGTSYPGAIAIANVIKGMGALLVMSLNGNRLATKESGKALVQALASNFTLKELDVSSNDWKTNSWDQKWQGDGAGFAQELAFGIKDNGALSKLAMRQNNIHGAEAGKAFADMLAQNTVLKELDLSSQACGTGGKALDAAFAKEFAVGISDNGTMLKLTFGNKQVVTMTTDMTEANFSGKLKSHEAQIVTAFLPKCT
jgi:hypothetical protein